jgi:predicted PurR-regulated permease PerM
LDSLTGQAVGWLVGTDPLAGTLRLANTALTVLSGIALALLTVYFVLYRGDRMARAGVQLLPARTRADVLDLGRRLWGTLGAYFRGQVLVGLVDAVLIGAGLLLLGVPLAVPLAVLVFIGAQVPIIGALVSGSLAVLVALADGGLGLALATLGVVVTVQFLEGNFIAPILMARMVRLSGFATIVAVSIGSTLWGVLGALLAVPVTACLTETVRFLRERAGADVPPAAVRGPRRSVEFDPSPPTHNAG